VCLTCGHNHIVVFDHQEIEVEHHVV
jgi:hypothetical protein